MLPLVAVFAFVFGAVIGSFLNAVMWRLHQGEGFVNGRSYCPECRHPLKAADLVPILSFVMLGGKCRYCKVGIHPSYLMTELAVGLLFTAFAWKVFKETPTYLPAGTIDGAILSHLLLQWYVVAMLVLIFVYDLRYMLIPRSVTNSASIIAAIGGLALGSFFPTSAQYLGMSPFSMALGAVIGGGVFWLQYVFSKGRWIGGGDIHLGILMGLVLGWPKILVALFLAYVAGALVASVLLAGKRAGWKSEIAFGTFLTSATLATMLWGDAILRWYLRLTF